MAAGEAALAAKARLNASQFLAILNSTTDGIALLDPTLRLVQWNQPFFQKIGTELRHEMPLDTLIRNQAANHLFDLKPDSETEIARRCGLLCVGEPAGLPQSGSDKTTLFLRGVPIAEGGLILVLNALPHWEIGPGDQQATENKARVSPATEEPPIVEHLSLRQHSS